MPNLFMTEVIIKFVLKPRGHVRSRLPVKKLRRPLQKRRKVKVFVWKGIRKNIISYYSSAFTIVTLRRNLLLKVKARSRHA